MFVQLLSGCFVAVAEDFHFVLSGGQSSFQGSSCFLLLVILPAVFAVVRLISHLEKFVEHVVESGIGSHPAFVDVEDVNLCTGIAFGVQKVSMTEHADDLCSERSFQRPQRKLNRLALLPTARNDEENVVAVAFEDNTPRPLLVFRIRRCIGYWGSENFQNRALEILIEDMPFITETEFPANGQAEIVRKEYDIPVGFYQGKEKIRVTLRAPEGKQAPRIFDIRFLK